MRANMWGVFTMTVVLCISGSGREVHGSNKYMNAASTYNVRRVVCTPIVNKETETKTTNEQNYLVFSRILTKRKNGKALSKGDIDWLFDAKNDGYFTKMEFVFIDSIINQSEYGRHKLKMQRPEFSLKGIVSLPLSLREQAKIIRSLQENGQ